TLFQPDPPPSDDASGPRREAVAGAAGATATGEVGPMPDGSEGSADDTAADADGSTPADTGTAKRQPSLLAEDAPPPAVAQLRERRPLWARLLGRLLRPWISLRIEPDAPDELVDQRPVCYVLEDYGLSNALILDRACR